MSDAGLEHLHSLPLLQDLNLGGLRVRCARWASSAPALRGHLYSCSLHWVPARFARTVPLAAAAAWRRLYMEAATPSTLSAPHSTPPLRSDEALAALLCRLPRLRRLNLERCRLAGRATLAALGHHVSKGTAAGLQL